MLTHPDFDLVLLGDHLPRRRLPGQPVGNVPGALHDLDVIAPLPELVGGATAGIVVMGVDADPPPSAHHVDDVVGVEAACAVNAHDVILRSDDALERAQGEAIHRPLADVQDASPERDERTRHEQGLVDAAAGLGPPLRMPAGVPVEELDALAVDADALDLDRVQAARTAEAVDEDALSAVDAATGGRHGVGRAA